MSNSTHDLLCLLTVVCAVGGLAMGLLAWIQRPKGKFTPTKTISFR